MNVLEICLSSGYGGLELYMAKVAGYLNTNKYNVRVMLRQGSFLDKRLGQQGLARNYLSVFFHHFPLFAARRLARYIREHQIDLIHVHHGKDVFLCVLAKVLAGRGRLVYTRQMALTRYKHDAYHRFIYRHVDAYLTITRTLQEDAIKYLPIARERVQLLYYGVPQPPVDKTNCAHYLQDNALDPAAFKVAIFGRVEEIKGQHLVVAAATRLIREGHKVQAAIIGHVMDQKYFAALQQDIERNKLQGAIRYLGFHDQPVRIMPCFDVVVLATRCETFGLVLPEAMRAGTCVIGTNCGGVPEIIDHGQTGLLFRPDDAEDLANQLRSLVSDKAYRKQLAEAGRREADARFSEEQHFERLLQIFTSLTSGLAPRDQDAVA